MSFGKKLYPVEDDGWNFGLDLGFAAFSALNFR